MRIEMLVVAATAGLLAAPVAAQEQLPREVVRYSDLDLTTSAGQLELTRRIDSAARSVCRIYEPRTGTMLPTPQARDCYKKAKATAQTRVAEVIAKRKRTG